MSQFPKDWPTKCPPDDAYDAIGAVFRVVSSDAPTSTDMRSYAELGLLPNASPCRRLALSVFRTHKEACHRLAMSPDLGAAVAKVGLPPGSGMMKLTNEQSGHIAWWPAANLDRGSLFGEVKRCQS